MTTLLLIRHGETDWIGKRLAGLLGGIPLNEKGAAQAEEVARNLAPLPIAAFYSSPIERARETAEAAARAAGMPVTEMQHLQEVDFGELTGKTFEELRDHPVWKQAHRDPSAVRYPGGESLQEVQQRAVAAVEEICRRHPQEAVALFSHSDTIRLVLCRILHMPLNAYAILTVDPASVSIVQRTEKREKVLAVNLPPDAPVILRGNKIRANG